MKKLIALMSLAGGVVIYAGVVFAGAAAASTGGEAATGTSGGPGAGADSSTGETGPGDRLGGPAAGYTNDPSVYRSRASAWPGEVDYPSASPRSGGIATSPATGGVVVPPPGRGITPSGRVDTFATPVMCPRMNDT